MEEKSFSCLLIEPAIPAHIFSYLSFYDLCSVELVCHAWRDVAKLKELAYWKDTLKRLYSRDVSWRSQLSRLSWLSDSDLTCKGLYMKIASELGPLVCSDFTSRMLQGDFTRADCESIVCATLEEKLFLKGFYSDRKEIFDMVEKCDTVTFVNHCRFSPLILTGPTAFPIVVSDHSGAECVLVAGATYGKGRVVVLGHEALCSTHKTCMQMVRYLADWCGRQPNCPIARARFTKHNSQQWGSWASHSWVLSMWSTLTRKQLLSDEVPVFITDGHSDDDADVVLEYVRKGGGLIIGGHAWQWGQTNHGSDVFQQHPGNRITSHMGIVFSPCIFCDPNLRLGTGVVPGLRHSLYYVHKWGRDDDSLQGYPIVQQMRDWLENSWEEKVKGDQFEDIDNVITNYMTKYDDDLDLDPNAEFLH